MANAWAMHLGPRCSRYAAMDKKMVCCPRSSGRPVDCVPACCSATTKGLLGGLLAWKALCSLESSAFNAAISFLERAAAACSSSEEDDEAAARKTTGWRSFHSGGIPLATCPVATSAASRAVSCFCWPPFDPWEAAASATAWATWELRCSTCSCSRNTSWWPPRSACEEQHIHHEPKPRVPRTLRQRPNFSARSNTRTSEGLAAGIPLAAGHAGILGGERESGGGLRALRA
mmetsp:Transcript_13284/g.31439  ORF Transcript_13284/g.31439 Transcript_13284/m.31439 type:complete len:231 (+) Transcript_13284:654-1346(+)